MCVYCSVSFVSTSLSVSLNRGSGVDTANRVLLMLLTSCTVHILHMEGISMHSVHHIQFNALVVALKNGLTGYNLFYAYQVCTLDT